MFHVNGFPGKQPSSFFEGFYFEACSGNVEFKWQYLNAKQNGKVLEIGLISEKNMSDFLIVKKNGSDSCVVI